MRYLSALCLWLLAVAIARADAPLVVVPVGTTKILVDGDLREWRGVRFARLGTNPGAQLAYALGYDRDALYLGARVLDDDFVRSRAPSPGEDAIVLTLVTPRAAGGTQASALWLYAGVPGKQRAELALRADAGVARAIEGASISEGPLDEGHGYVIEARIPWAAIPGGADFGVARGAIALHDVDRKPGAPAHEIASAPVRAPSALPWLMVEDAPNAAIATFLRDHELGSANVRYDLLGDVQGDARSERVIVAGTFVAIAGPEIGAGSGYAFAELPAARSSDVVAAVLRDEDGDGKSELVVTLRGDAEPHVYRWQGSTLALRATSAPPAAPHREAVAATHANSSGASAQPATSAPDVKAVIAAFRAARGIDARERARFVEHVNLVEDARRETVMVFGKDVLVAGPGFRGGTGYFYFELPVRDRADVIHLFTGDVTGDGRRELFVRTRQQLGDVERDVLHAYSFDGDGMREIVTLEVRRRQAGNQIANRVALAPAHGRFVLQIEAGIAEGWNAQNYPFVEGSLDAVAPLLLPWRDGVQRFRFDGEQLVRAP